MKTRVSNFYGCQDKYDLQLYKLTLDLEESTEKEALDSGWSIYKGEWYLSRLVRIDLSLYDKKPKVIPKHVVRYHDNIRDIHGLCSVYDKFIEHKKFAVTYELYSDVERSAALVVYKDDVAVAATKFMNYDGGIESQFTVWDYAEPRLSIGKKIVDYEVEHAKKIGMEYLYIGPGYGINSSYKADFPGFQWWTGTYWSSDKDKYLSMCATDSSIRDLDDLSRLYNEEVR